MKRGGYDLVLMDCQMPVMDGFEATRNIRRSSRSGIPIVALTADALPADRDRCLRGGMNDYLAKPLELERLTEILAMWLPAPNDGDALQSPELPHSLPKMFRDQPDEVGRGAMGLMLVFWLAGKRKSTRRSWSNLAQPHEIAFAIAAFLSPLVTIAYCIWSGVPYWSRYGVSAALGGSLILAALLAFITKRNSKATVASAAVILILFCMTRAMTGSLSENYRNTSAIYRTIRPELPFVAASGLTFLEMDHREPPGFTNRLFYLTDKDSALRYHATIFEGFPILQKWFPVRAKVEPYQEFIRRNREFLVLATPGYPEDWLLLKLKSDGAEIRLCQDSRTGYRDHALYEVRVRPQGSPAPDESRSARRVE